MTRYRNLGDLIDRSRPLDDLAIIDLRDAEAPRTLTHSEVDRLANGVARRLVDLGLERGSHVAIAAANRAEYLIAYFGIMRAGLIAVPINIKAPDTTLDHVLKDSDARLVFVDAGRRARLEGKLPIVDFDDDGPGGFTAWAPPADFAPVAPGPGEIAQMLYTSGSTGLPKGVRLSHAGQLWALSAVLRHVPREETQSRYLLAQPLFHMNGLFMAKRAFATNALLVILPSFDVATYVHALETFRITTLTAVPTMFARIVRDPAILLGRDVSSLRRVMLGSAPMTHALLDRIQEAFPHVHITHGYGTTEAGPAVFGPHPQGLPTPPLGLGYVLDDVEVRLLDADGREADEGVLWIRNPAVMAGYHKLPARTAEVLKDGWYCTGDVMRRDGNGFFYFVGRADDMFVVSGENVYPGEVEKTLESHPAVRQACVVPIPDEERGHIPVAFIVSRPGQAPSEHEIRQYALTHGPAYQHPRRVYFLDALPWAGTNKVDRNALRELALQLERRPQERLGAAA